MYRLNPLEFIKNLQALSFLDTSRIKLNCGDYRDYEYKKGDVVYCDPPYENTEQYDYEKNLITKTTYYSKKAKRNYTKTQKASFNSQEFYDWVYTRPYPVYFSSYEIGDKRFKTIWQKQKLLNFYYSKKENKRRHNTEYLYWNGK